MVFIVLQKVRRVRLKYVFAGLINKKNVAKEWAKMESRP